MMDEETPTTVGHQSRRTADRRVPLSVVVITENEEDRIQDCLESIFTVAEQAVPAFEVVLVDSASTDRTVDIASEYPVTVLRIPDEHTVSCGAGRFVGDSVVDGELVLHVDGDMILTETWLPRAVEYLREHDDVAGVEGHLNRSSGATVEPVKKVGGVMLFDADALESVGGFDPYLLGYEDVDVGYRLTSAGYRLVRLPEVSADHPDGGTFSEPLRRWRAGYYLAPGQAIRKSLTSPRVLVKLLARQRFKLLLLTWLAVGVVSVASAGLLAGWILLSAGAAGVIVRKRGVRGGFEWLVGKTLGTVGMLRGIWLRTHDADEYPLAAIETVQEGRVVESGARSTEF